MMHHQPRRLTMTALVALAGACRAPAPATPAPATTPDSAHAAHASHQMAAMAMPDATPDSARRGYTAADVRFVQHMIGHHAQALVMTALVPSRTTRDDMRLLAERIDVSQRSEIAMMQRWLGSRGETVPDMRAHMAMPMPGMLTDSELATLAAAKGPEFDRLFLRYMIRHHEGALAMVAELFASPGAGQESQLYDFASGVDADQRAEIARMQSLLRTIGQ